MILERDKKNLPRDKRLAIHRFLDSITRMDYQCLNRPIKWEDDIGEHIGIYHPMDLLHFLIKNLDIPSRCKLYHKLSSCKLALPVLFPYNDPVYMDISLRQVKITRKSEGHIVEEDVTNAAIPLISMIRCGQQSPGSFSKSKLANDLLKFKCDAEVGSCGFFTKNSLSSNGFRKVAKGTVEGMWFEGRSDLDMFPTSFGLLNLRGDALQHLQTASKLASCSDVVFMFCNTGMFGNLRYKDLLLDAAKILKTKEEGERKINKLFVIFNNREAQRKIKENRKLFEDISETVSWEKVGNNYQTFLSSAIGKIQNSLKDASKNFIKSTLNHRLRQENKESSTANIESAKHITHSILKVMDMIKNADEDKRMYLRQSLFPLQSTTKDYAQTQREERRSLDIDKKIKLGDELIAFRNSRFQKIKDGLPDIMSSFLRELFNSRTVDQKLMFVRNVQYNLDDWCSKYLFNLRMQYSDSLKKLATLKEREIGIKRTKEINEELHIKLRKNIQMETKRCKNLSKLLLDMSIGIESIFREIGEICETTKRYEESLVKDLAFFNKKLPELAALLLTKGVAIEIMDGDGLSVPIGWLEEVMKTLGKCFKDTYNMKKDPKIFVLTVLGTQSTGKSTLLNTMFGVQFPVSAGRCTKGAFMQLVPIFIDGFPYNGLLIIDTEGLGAPEYRQDNTHDNEIATFVLGISDLAMVNVRGELPTNIENFLQVSTCALMRMSMVDFHPSIIFVHQNCDPSSKEKNLTGRHTFMKVMDEVVSTQARLNQKQDLFTCFQDVVDISLDDEKSDFVYFPQLLEGSPPMSPPSRDYSESCSNLTSYIITKMQEKFEKYKKAHTFQEFAEKVELVWKGVLEENFVLSLINIAEIQVKYDIDNQMNHWKLAMEGCMENILESFCGEIKANFKAKQPSLDILREQTKQLETESNATNNEQKKKLKDYIKKQVLHRAMYQKWEQKCMNKMDKICERIMENCQRRLNEYYDHEKDDAKWRFELQQSKNTLQHTARQIANDLIQKKEEKAGKNIAPDFSDHEIEKEFQKFWISEKERFISKREKTFAPVNIQQIFISEIHLKYGHVAKFQKIFEEFGANLQNEFKIERIKPSYVEFQGTSMISKLTGISEAKFLEDMRYLIPTTERTLTNKVIGLYEVGGLTKMLFQPNSTTFDCGTLIKQYLAKAIDILVQTHKETQQNRKYNFNLTDRFEAMFSFFAAQCAIKNFETAQQSFINYMDISTKLEIEKENIKQIFTLILKNEETLTIATKQIIKRLHQSIKNAALKQVVTPCKDILLQLVTQKMHVQGLVLHDIIDKLDRDISKENIVYIQEYFSHPARLFRRKISHIFDGCHDIRLDRMIGEKFDAATKELKDFFETNLELSKQLPLIEVICRNSFIKSLGIGEADFDDIIMPQVTKDEPSKFNVKCYGLSENKTETIEKEVKERMKDETDIIKKLKTFISEKDGVNTDITVQQAAEIKEKIISDVYNHLFDCTKMCPFCHALCDKTHSGKVELDSKHASRCHRPMGFAQHIMDKTNNLVTAFCNDAVQSELSFKNADTNFQLVRFKDYREVNSDYKSWNFKVMESDSRLCWKYITQHVTDNPKQFFPGATIALPFWEMLQKWFQRTSRQKWGRITKYEAKRNVNSLFHLRKDLIVKNKDGFHYIGKKLNDS